MRYSVYALTVLVLFGNGLRGEGICSLAVQVETPFTKGIDAPAIATAMGWETRVVVEESNGWRREGTTYGGKIRFCGLGVSPISIIVGNSQCNQVIIRNVQLSLRETRMVTVYSDDTFCNEERVPGFGCAVLLRFVDTAHNPIGAVALQGQNLSLKKYLSDDYGRIVLGVGGGQSLSGEAFAKGYQPRKVDVPCQNQSRSQTLEQIVILEKAGGD